MATTQAGKRASGMRAGELQPCALCGQGVMHNGVPLFWRIELQRLGVDLAAADWDGDVLRQRGAGAGVHRPGDRVAGGGGADDPGVRVVRGRTDVGVSAGGAGMMGWGIALVLLIERGVPWWLATPAVVVGPFVEGVGRACYDGLKRGIAEGRAERAKAGG